MKNKIHIFVCLCLFALGCSQPEQETEDKKESLVFKIFRHRKPLVPDVTVSEISLTKNLEYDKYTLEDEYKYLNKERSFKWDKIKRHLAFIENIQHNDNRWVVIQNYKNSNKEAPAVRSFTRNEYGRVCDTLMVEKYQSAPLYFPEDTSTAIIYARDGSIAEFIDSVGSFYKIKPANKKEMWYIPSRYVRFLKPETSFEHVVVVDRGDQNITTLRRTSRAHWDILSMNPATTGQHNPPYAQETPLGMFLLQEKKEKMFFWKDGTREIGGYAPFASRFTCGAYLHGVPVNLPAKDNIEYSWTLGTTPRSHMCVRNATSHSQFIYETMPMKETLVVVLE